VSSPPAAGIIKTGKALGLASERCTSSSRRWANDAAGPPTRPLAMLLLLQRSRRWIYGQVRIKDDAGVFPPCAEGLSQYRARCPAA